MRDPRNYLRFGCSDFGDRKAHSELPLLFVFSQRFVCCSFTLAMSRLSSGYTSFLDCTPMSLLR